MRIIREITNYVNYLSIRYYYAKNEVKLNESKFEIAGETKDGYFLSKHNNADQFVGYQAFLKLREMEIAVVYFTDIGQGIIEAYVYSKQAINILYFLLIEGIKNKCSNIKFKCETIIGLIEPLVVEANRKNFGNREKDSVNTVEEHKESKKCLKKKKSLRSKKN